MTNKNPVNKRDFHSVKNPKFSVRDVLIWIADTCPSEVTSRMVVEHFWPNDQVRRLAECSSKLIMLQKWQCLSVRSAGFKHRGKVYEITDWGLKMAEKWSNEK